MKGTVSIIIPVYNREKYLEECIDSVYKQTYQQFEIILIDDGSTDRSPEIAAKLAENDSRITLLTTAHQGVSAARNAALEVVRGEFVFFLDSDDIIHPLLLETFVTSLNDTDASIAGSQAPAINEKYWDRVLKKVESDKGPGETTYQNPQDTLHAFFHTWLPISNIGGVMIRRDRIGDTRFRTDLFIGEDFYFVYQNLLKGLSTVFLKQKWYYARWHESNTSQDLAFSGFWTRFYRRKLVWESEEALGRAEYAALQKMDAVACYMRCLSNGDPRNAEIKKMKAVMREHTRVLWPDLNWKWKIWFCLSMYMPYTFKIVHSLKNKYDVHRKKSMTRKNKKTV